MPWSTPDKAPHRTFAGAVNLHARTSRRQAVLGLVSMLGLVGLLSCGTPSSAKTPSTLWVNYGQSELDLILVESEPPYY